ncbi:MAG: hypothetical protein WBP64_02630 [Nitrososphaeraceae archaeon]
MSIKVLRLGTTGMKQIIGSYVREHGSEIAIVGIMTTVLVGIAALATGDITHVLATGRHH